MSLKAFHIFFVVVCVLVCAVAGYWGLQSFFTDGNATSLSIGVVCIVVGLGLIVYGFKVAKKLKNVGYL